MESLGAGAFGKVKKATNFKGEVFVSLSPYPLGSEDSEQEEAEEKAALENQRVHDAGEGDRDHEKSNR